MEAQALSSVSEQDKREPVRPVQASALGLAAAVVVTLPSLDWLTVGGAGQVSGVA